MNISFFSSSSFTLPIIEDIFNSQDLTIKEVFLKQYNNLDFDQLEDNSTYPKGFNDKDYLLKHLDKLPNSKIKLSSVVSSHEKENRGKIILNPVLEFARKHNILNFSPLKLNLASKQLESLYLADCDVALLASYGQIISNSILQMPRHGFINWHPSLLPKYRGASPMQEAIINGDEISGLTWLEMVQKMDAGDIWFQFPYRLSNDMRLQDLIALNVDLGVKTWALPIVSKMLYQLDT